MINGYTVLLTLHILCAVTWVGGSVMLQVMGRLVASSGDRQRMLEFARLAGRLAAVMFAPLSVGVLLFGIFLVKKAGYEMSDGFVGIGYLGFVVSLLLGATYYPRAARRRDAIADGAEGVESDAFLAVYTQVRAVATVETLVLLVVVCCMAIKPGV